MIAFKPRASEAGNGSSPAIRGPSSSSTALDPEPTTQIDPKPSFGLRAGNGSCCPETDFASATERAIQAAREGSSPEGRPLDTRAAISATGITWAVDIASMTRVA
jgi:hypothetical protein